MTKKELIDGVKAHALENYETGGWDYVVECYSDEEIGEAIGKARTLKGAIKKIGEIVGIRDEVRRDVQGWAF